MGKRPKEDDGGEALAAALEKLDELHAAIVELADVSDLSPEAEDELTSVSGNRLPLTLFAVGEENAVGGRSAALPKGYQVGFETRLTLSLTAEQAEALAFVLLREVRKAEGDDDVEIDLDGRALFDKASARDLADALGERSEGR